MREWSAVRHMACHRCHHRTAESIQIASCKSEIVIKKNILAVINI